MKFAIPEISWHNRDPVLSVDFQPRSEDKSPLRLATGGTDSHVLIWYLTTTESGGVNLEVAADLTRHQKAVNVVRWSPDGQMLASGDDESIIFVWKQKLEKEAPSSLEGEEQYKETWVIYKTLRGHMEDVLDLSWSPDSQQLASGSVDNKLLIWDVNRGRYTSILSDHKGFVQGVAWDPKGQYIVTASSDRTFRAFDVSTKKVVARSSKAKLPFPAGHFLHDTTVRLYHDDTLQTFYRRLHWSPDGLLIAVPAGRAEPEGKLDGKPINAVYIYTRYSLKVPMCVVPCGEPALAVRWAAPALLARAPGAAPPPAIPAPARRHVLAVATRRHLLLYDTHQKTPLAFISNIHYTRLTDITWSPEGRALVASSTDGFCSVITFAEDELGQRLTDDDLTEPMETKTAELTDTKEKPEISKITPRTDNNKMTSKSEPNKLAPKADTNYLTPKSEANKLTPKSEPNKLTPKSQPSKLAPKSEANKLTPKSEPNKLTPKSQPNRLTPRSKLDSFVKFKTPTDKKTEPKTPVKMDVLEETAMPSWSDNSNNEIIRPKDTEMEVDNDIMIIEDSEDIKLVYDETQTNTEKSPDQTDTKKHQKSPDSDTKKSPKHTSNTQNSAKAATFDVTECTASKTNDVSESSSESAFLKQAKVTDVKETAPAPVIPSPKAPRRVNFVTLSSPKNKKKK